MLAPADLERLRGIVRSLQSDTSLTEVVRLARELRLRSGLTVDFAATRELGHPMVVVREPPAPLPSASLRGLTQREQEVVSLIAAGLSNKEIARRLSMTVGTVKYHVHHILEKTGLPGRVALAQAHREATHPNPSAPSIFG